MGTCSVVVRMVKDFAADVLPTGDGTFFPTTRGKIHQVDKWATIANKLLAVANDCVQGQGWPGWALETHNILVGFWPKTSAINRRYGRQALWMATGSNSSVSQASVVSEQ